MELEARLAKLEKDFAGLAAEHDALWQICHIMFSVIPLPDELLEPLLTLSYDNLAQRLIAGECSDDHQRATLANHDALSAAILDRSI